MTAIRVFLGYGLIFITQYLALVVAVIVLLIWTSPRSRSPPSCSPR